MNNKPVFPEPVFPETPNSEVPYNCVPKGATPFSITEGNVTLKGFKDSDGTVHIQEEIAEYPRGLFEK